MDRKSSLALFGLSGLLVLLLGSGVIGLLSDSIASPGNDVSSPEFSSHDVEAARSVAHDGCASATYADGPLTALIDGGSASAEAASFITETEDDYLCVKNSGSGTGILKVTFGNVSNTEVGACNATETAAESPGSCADGNPGELSAILTAAFLQNPGSGTSDSCVTPAVPQFIAFSSFSSGAVTLDPSIGPGQFCVFQLNVASPASGATDTQKAAAQTDKTEWDITFTLTDS